MHPDLFMIRYRQQELELEQRLQQRLALEEYEPSRVIGFSERFASLVRRIEGLGKRARSAAPEATCCAIT